MKSIKAKCHLTTINSHVMPTWFTCCDHDVGSNQKSADSKLYEFVQVVKTQPEQQVMPDDHSEVVPLLPIPNRTVKRLCADDSAGSRVKVGHRQALTKPPKPPVATRSWGFGLYISVGRWFSESKIFKFSLTKTEKPMYTARLRCSQDCFSRGDLWW